MTTPEPPDTGTETDHATELRVPTDELVGDELVDLDDDLDVYPSGDDDFTDDLSFDFNGDYGNDTDTSDGAHAPTQDDYDAFVSVVEQVMSDSGDQGQDAGDDQGDDGPAPSIADPDLAEYVAKLRRQDARKRLRLQESEARLQAAGRENGRLTDIVEAHLRADVEREAAKSLHAAGDLWRVADLSDVTTDDGTAPDLRKLAHVIADKIPQHWQKPPREFRYYGDALGSGSTSRQIDVVPSSWAEALGKLTE
ncbi:hypothetical protein ACGFK1_11735 [Mycobacterium sp. NPDC048908]|uniref:hypothetical protein n=1 Tax=Mycobacterium sp. NPDC048908 TaxID=3364292 RepID=UPI003723740C